jgi:hypothetical protein
MGLSASFNQNIIRQRLPHIVMHRWIRLDNTSRSMSLPTWRSAPGCPVVANSGMHVQKVASRNQRRIPCELPAKLAGPPEADSRQLRTAHESSRLGLGADENSQALEDASSSSTPGRNATQLLACPSLRQVNRASMLTQSPNPRSENMVSRVMMPAQRLK